MKTPTFNAYHKDYPVYRQKCAEIDGYTDIYIDDDGILGGYKNSKLVPKQLPLYDNETDILRVVRTLKDQQSRNYTAVLRKLVGLNDGVLLDLDQHRLSCATADQMAEALYRTLMGGEK